MPSFRRLSHSKDILEHIDLYKYPHISYMRHNVIDFDFLFGNNDLFYLLKCIEDIQGVGLIKILPYGQVE